MVSINYHFDEFIAFVRNKTFQEAVEIAEQESRAVHSTIALVHTDTLMQTDKVAYYRKLRAFCFFFAHGIKPEGLDEQEFKMLGALSHKWVCAAQLSRGYLTHFPAGTLRPIEVVSRSA